MSIKDVEIQDDQGNIYYPHTNASLVKYNESTVEEALDAHGTSLSENEQDIAKKIDKTSIVNNLTATVAGSVLDATQGKALQDSINTINNTLASKATIQKGSTVTVAAGATTYFDMTGFGIAALRATGVSISCELCAIFSINTLNQYVASTKILDRVDFGASNNITISFSTYVMVVVNNTSSAVNFTFSKMTLI
ncbi:hypothetical protein [Clostridium sp. BL-8]|uniref:hypothetical protein n=1 Tax=Clostridium sp. BL-8 TaxID=349938 RepID=UPI00098C1F33|nr:hypothetical protein [Clostridium sp. BL-8]OOM75507.1 hypothetical protein CLOBL_39970 [Clostridium sp. BL-8]